MSFKIHKDARIHPSVFINVKSGFIGPRAIINEGVRIEGNHIEIGTEAFIDRYATIGGGSAFDRSAHLIAGDWFHMGVNSQINIARGVLVGHEFGFGIDSKLFTHGSYIDGYNFGAPVQWEPVVIGDNVWCPNVWINPGSKIGDNVVVAAGSVVSNSIPSYCLAAGSPAKVIRENMYINNSNDSKILFFEKLCSQLKDRPEINSHVDLSFSLEKDEIKIMKSGKTTIFNLKYKSIGGISFHEAEIFKDQLRRNGIRFRFISVEDSWIEWHVYDKEKGASQ